MQCSTTMIFVVADHIFVADDFGFERVDESVA